METYMPFEMLSHILCRVPAPSLVRFKLVCKQWYSLIHDQDFIYQHLDHANRHSSSSSSSSDDSCYVVSFNTDESKILLRPLDDDDEDDIVEKRLPKAAFRTVCYTLPSCNGLICVIDVERVHVCNLTTQRIVTLPQSGSERFPTDYCFGFDPSTKQYKVLQLRSNLQNDSFDCEVFTLGTKAWRAVGNIPYQLFVDNYVLLNGALHWTTWSEFIISFDLRSEKYRTIPLPPEYHLDHERRIDERDSLILIDLQGKLGLLDIILSEDRIDIWKLKDSNNHVWIKDQRVELHPDHPDLQLFWTDFLFPITIHGGKILVLTGKDVLCYDPQRKYFTKIYIADQKEHYATTMLQVESLVPLGNSTSVENPPSDSTDISIRQCNFLEMAMQKEGSQNLQIMLKVGDADEINTIWDGIIGSIFVLMTHQFGNKVFQSLLLRCSNKQLRDIVGRVTKQAEKLIDAVKNRHGSTSTVKFSDKLIDKVKLLPLLMDVTSVLATSPISLMTNKFGMSVIQHCVTNLTYEQNSFLVEAAIDNFLILATHKQGYLALKCFIQSLNEKCRKDLGHLVEKVIENSLLLAKESYGNYILQQVVELNMPEVNICIHHHLGGSYVRLSMQKCGSHVVQSCLHSVIGNLVFEELSMSDQIVDLVQNFYGYQVIRAAMMKDNLSPIIHAVHALGLWNLPNNQNGKYVFDLLDQILSG